MQLGYTASFRDGVDRIVDYEQAGLGIAMVPELYSFDAVSQLGYLAARTSTVELASGILPIYSRTPALLAMTAAGLDYVSDGRFTLGIGASGPQVIEGLHGVAYNAPVGRTREIIEICRQVWRREPLEHQGAHYTLPLPAEQGTGLGKPLKLVNRPVRPSIPIMIGASGPKFVELAAEVANSWLGIFFHPGRAHDVFGPSLASGLLKRDPELGPLDVAIPVSVAIGTDVGPLKAKVRAQLALYVGGMGARGANFYNNLAIRYGYPDEAATIQDLYLAGNKEQAAAAVPDELIDAVSLVGSEAEVADRVAAFAAAGVTTLVVSLLAEDEARRLQDFEKLAALC
jgi:F420-dependent oxidoreductase-like protein